MANYSSSKDLVDDLLFRAGEPTDGTSDFDSAALRYLNRAYQGIWQGGSELDPNISEVWWWLRKDSQGVLTLNPRIDSGTASVTNNSATITFSSSITPDLAGRHFKVDDHADVFIISTHGGSTDTATLESVYTGETDGTASYKVFQVDYSLASDLLYLSTPMFAFQDSRREIPGISLEELRAKWPLNEIGSGVPKNFAMVGEQKIRFSHYGGTSSTDLIKTDYEYIREPSDLSDSGSDTPLVPRQYRKILADWALSYVLADKGDNRAGALAELARRGLVAMALDNRRRMAAIAGDVFGRIQPRQREVQRFKGPLRTESGLLVGGLG